MAAEVHPIKGYSFSGTEALLFDANIWLALYHPAGADRRQVAIYSRAFKRILKAGSSIFLDVLVLSEFINRCARLAHRRDRPRESPRDFKRYRDSAEFAPVARDIANTSRRILGYCTRTESCFESVDAVALLSDYETARPDFNDLILAEVCKAKGLTLVTHDADFRRSPIRVLTANTKLLG